MGRNAKQYNAVNVIQRATPPKEILAEYPQVHCSRIINAGKIPLESLLYLYSGFAGAWALTWTHLAHSYLFVKQATILDVINQILHSTPFLTIVFFNN